jgi:hypothetical protein
MLWMLLSFGCRGPVLDGPVLCPLPALDPSCFSFAASLQKEYSRIQITETNTERLPIHALPTLVWSPLLLADDWTLFVKFCSNKSEEKWPLLIWLISNGLPQFASFSC